MNKNISRDEVLSDMLNTPAKTQKQLKQERQTLERLREFRQKMNEDDEYSDFQMYEIAMSFVDEDQRVTWEEYKQALYDSKQ